MYIISFDLYISTFGALYTGVDSVTLAIKRLGSVDPTCYSLLFLIIYSYVLIASLSMSNLYLFLSLFFLLSAAIFAWLHVRPSRGRGIAYSCTQLCHIQLQLRSSVYIYIIVQA